MNTSRSFQQWFLRQLSREQMTQADFSRRSGVPRSTVNTWAMGMRIPDPASCQIIADALYLDDDVVLDAAGHRTDVEEVPPEDPRRTLISKVKRIDWDAQSLALVNGMLDQLLLFKRQMSGQEVDEVEPVGAAADIDRIP